MTKPNLLYYFRRKDDIYLAILRRTLELWLQPLESLGESDDPIAEIRAFTPAEGGRVLDRNGKEMAKLDPIQRINVPLSAVPTAVREAFIATEDRRFYDHGNVDLRGALRALVRNVATLSVREGFSTITMQAARNTFLAHRFAYTDRSLRRMRTRIPAMLPKDTPSRC